MAPQPQGAQGDAQRIAAAQPASLGPERAPGGAGAPPGPNPGVLAGSPALLAQRQAIQRVLDSPRMTAQRSALQRIAPPVRVARTPVQRVTSALPGVDKKDYQSEFHNTDTVARASLLPIAHSLGGEQFKATELWVREVRLSNDRPPTKFGSGGQRSHTVAWSLLRRAIQNLGGQTLAELVAMLDEMAAMLQTPGNSVGAANAFGAVKGSLAKGLATMGNGSTQGDFATWQISASELVGQYVHAYQLSEEATYADGQAVGHGEPTHMATLDMAETKLKLGGDVSGQLGNIAVAAKGMLDFKTRLGSKVVGGLLHHWLTDMHLAFPLLMAKHGDAITGSLGIGDNDRLLMKGALGHDPLVVSDKVTGKNNGRSASAEAVLPETALPFTSRSTFTANVAVVPNATGVQRDVKMAERKNGNIVQEGTLKLQHYRIGEINIDRLDVADDRPNTRFGALQRSHTVAWTLVRRHLINFKGRPGTVLANFVLNELAMLQKDIDTPQQNAKISFDAPAQAAQKHTNLKALAAHSDGLPLFQWQTLLSELVETYITLYQLSRSATYSKEERPKGHGESQAIATLLGAETDLSKQGANPKAYAEEHLDDLVEQAVKLVDAAVATSSLQPQNWRIAIEHWLRLLEDHYPKVFALPGFLAGLKEEVTVMEPRSELLAGYKNSDRLGERDKVLINLYENARNEVKQIPNAFVADLKSSMRLSLADIMPPDYDDWEYATRFNLSVKFPRRWAQTLSAFTKQPSRRAKDLRDVPNEKAINELIKAAKGYFKAVETDREELKEFYTEKIIDRALDRSTVGIGKFAEDNEKVIETAVDKAITEALELSALGTIENYKTWYDLLNKIEKKKNVNYNTLIAAIETK